jgi:2-iminobutanoate/2-iminopropanoate deaminase
MKTEVVCTPNAPAPVGPYSQAVKAGDTLYCAGQIPLNPSTGAIPDGIEAQTRQVLENLKAVLTAGGADFPNVVKTTVFLKDMNDFPAMNAIYGSAFTGAAPEPFLWRQYRAL